MLFRSNLKKLQILLPEIKIKDDASMAEYCSFRAGGRVASLIEPGTVGELKEVLRFVTEENIPHIILGNGTNTLFSDGEHELAVIKLSDDSEDFSHITVDEAACTAEAGGAALLSSVSRAAAEKSLAGMEGLSGIPGSIGGGVFMNAPSRWRRRCGRPHIRSNPDSEARPDRRPYCSPRSEEPPV